jgi:hypothetical protein
VEIVDRGAIHCRTSDPTQHNNPDRRQPDLG